MRLLKYLEAIPCVSILSLQVEEVGNRFNYQYRAAQGFLRSTDYGIKVARMCGLPDILISNAIAIKHQVFRFVLFHY
jgi:DNA mismatch repair ATPase MutS